MKAVLLEKIDSPLAVKEVRLTELKVGQVLVKVPVTVLEEGMDKSYCGSGELLKTFDINFIGLKEEIKNCYEYFCKRNI